MTEIDVLVRDSIKQIKEYSRPPILDTGIKLNQNESPYGLPLEVVREFEKRLAKLAFNRYPEGSSEKLRIKIARKFKTNPDQIVVGCGIDEILYYLLMAFVEKGDKLVRPVPSFGMYPICAQVSAAKDVPVQLSDKFDLTEEFVTQSKDAKMTIICSPNNPTGNCMNKKLIERIIQGTLGLVVIDEAYADFAESDCMDFLKYDNVILLRTFSKAGSFASGRLGFSVSSKKIADYINRVRLPWNVSAMVQELGELILDYEPLFLEKIEQIKKDRNVLLSELKKIVKTYPTDCNFFLFEVKDPKKVFEKLISEGVLTRNISGNSPRLKNCLRVCVGTREENEKFLRALKRCLE
ncbi:histidinol-phosphate transaminase [Candidatus Micrarchaeota archaeon]|nr:histidinol-phosphate transaminase [Candidatus Micrarchaeota archaeon]